MWGLMMDRRTFLETLAGGFLAAPLDAQAQDARLFRIGVLLTSDVERTQARLRKELQELGYVQGQNSRIEFRSVAADQSDRLADLAAELVRLKVDVIVAQFTPAAKAAKSATTVIPVVMAPAGDPVGTGLVSSLGRPGGNVTGVSGSATELGGKLLQLIRELLPAVSNVAVLVHTTDPFAKPFLDQIQAGARDVGVQIQPFVVQGARGIRYLRRC